MILRFVPNFDWSCALARIGKNNLWCYRTIFSAHLENVYIFNIRVKRNCLRYFASLVCPCLKIDIKRGSNRIALLARKAKVSLYICAKCACLILPHCIFLRRNYENLLPFLTLIVIYGNIFHFILRLQIIFVTCSLLYRFKEYICKHLLKLCVFNPAIDLLVFL